MNIVTERDPVALRKRLDAFVLAVVSKCQPIGAREILDKMDNIGFSPWTASQERYCGRSQLIGTILTKLSRRGQLRNLVAEHKWVLAGEATRTDVSQKMNASAQHGISRVVNVAQELERCAAEFPHLADEIDDNKRAWIELAQEEFGT